MTGKKENFNRTRKDPPTNHPKICRIYLNLSAQIKKNNSKIFFVKQSDNILNKNATKIDFWKE